MGKLSYFMNKSVLLRKKDLIPKAKSQLKFHTNNTYSFARPMCEN